MTTVETYYDRSSSLHGDGTRIFKNAADDRNEMEVARILELAWDCQIRKFGELTPIDSYAVRYGRMCCLLEIKCRTHESTRYPTVFLNVRKWLALSIGAVGLGCAAIFVARFTDGVFWVDLTSIDATNHRIAGCLRRVKADNDIEPVIDVPMNLMINVHG